MKGSGRGARFSVPAWASSPRCVVSPAPFGELKLAGTLKRAPRRLQNGYAHAGQPHFRGTMPVLLGIDSYTLRGLRSDALQLLDYAAQVGIQCIQFSGLPHLHLGAGGPAPDHRNAGALRGDQPLPRHADLEASPGGGLRAGGHGRRQHRDRRDSRRLCRALGRRRCCPTWSPDSGSLSRRCRPASSPVLLPWPSEASRPPTRAPSRTY